jgi:hypothetical protein
VNLDGLIHPPQLRPLLPPAQLAPIIVTAHENPLPAGIMRVEERRRLGIGKFITREMLDERDHDTVADLAWMAGMTVRRPSDCGGAICGDRAGHCGGGVKQQSIHVWGHVAERRSRGVLHDRVPGWYPDGSPACPTAGL